MGITEVLQKIIDTSSSGNIKLGEIIQTLESRGFGPLLLTPALIAMLPTGAIPGIPSICGIVIFLIAVQILIGNKHPWIPSKIRDITFEREQFVAGIEKLKPATKKIDELLKPRLTFLAQDIATRILALLCAIVGLSMIPLEMVPFAAALPAFAVTLLAVGLITKDGCIILFAIMVFAISMYSLLISVLG